MPKELEQRLKREAQARGYSKERTRRYVFGTLTNIKKRKKRRSRRG